MPSPFAHKELPPFLTNFNFEHDFDKQLYEYVTEGGPGRKFDEVFIRSIQKHLADTERDGDSSRYEIQLLKYWLEYAIKAIEMERLAMALDLKLSMLADHVLEPWPGMFENVGISRVYKAHAHWSENRVLPVSVRDM